jgi:hypothetical protein
MPASLEISPSLGGAVTLSWPATVASSWLMVFTLKTPGAPVSYDVSETLWLGRSLAKATHDAHLCRAEWLDGHRFYSPVGFLDRRVLIKRA